MNLGGSYMQMPNYGDVAYALKGSKNLNYTITSVPLIHRTLNIAGKDYSFLKELGSGGFGHVYVAERKSDKRKFAIKVTSLATVNPAHFATYRESILNEIAMSKRLSKANSHIVKMYGFDFHEKTGLGFLIMELGNEDLEKALQRYGHLSPKERKFVWRQLVSIAMILHNHGIVHLDLKPQNLIVFEDKRIKLIDLGIAQKADTRRRGRNGTRFYSAPEVFEPWSASILQNTSKADSWSWGAILYRIAYLQPPTYDEPCYVPPNGRKVSRDSDLVHVLKNTLVRDPNKRASIPWLSQHHYTLL